MHFHDFCAICHGFHYSRHYILPRKGHFLLHFWKSLLEEAFVRTCPPYCILNDLVIRIVFVATLSSCNHKGYHLYLGRNKLQHQFQFSLKNWCEIETVECFRQWCWSLAISNWKRKLNGHDFCLKWHGVILPSVIL